MGHSAAAQRVHRRPRFAAYDVAPWRTGMPDRPAVAVPPARMPLVAYRGRPLKRWRWVGAFADDVMLCAAVAHVGPAPVSWWAVWERDCRTLHERTVRRAGPVRLGAGKLVIEDRGVRADLAIEERPGVETISPHGRGHVWTRKQGGVRITGTLTVAGRGRGVEARGIVDDSAGYHARDTAWRWSAGVGESAAGAPVAWNLVEGLHDDPRASERSVWVDGEPHEVGPVTFRADLSGVAFAEGGALAFAAEAARAHRDRALVVASDYEQPFGSFTGELPGAGELRRGLGVMERHVARW